MTSSRQKNPTYYYCLRLSIYLSIYLSISLSLSIYLSLSISLSHAPPLAPPTSGNNDPKRRSPRHVSSIRRRPVQCRTQTCAQNAKASCLGRVGYLRLCITMCENGSWTHCLKRHSSFSLAKLTCILHPSTSAHPLERAWRRNADADASKPHLNWLSASGRSLRAPHEEASTSFRSPRHSAGDTPMGSLPLLNLLDERISASLTALETFSSLSPKARGSCFNTCSMSSSARTLFSVRKSFPCFAISVTTDMKSSKGSGHHQP